MRQPSHLVVMLFGERQKHPKPPRIRSADSAVARLTSASTDRARGLRPPATALGNLRAHRITVLRAAAATLSAGSPDSGEAVAGLHR
jgi:hypothetical protein